MFASRGLRSSAAFQSAALREAWRLTSFAGSIFKTAEMLEDIYCDQAGAEAAATFVYKL